MFRENKLEFKQGRLLIAEPFMEDNFFKRAVVLLSEVNEKGTVGFILNKPIDMMIHEIVPDFPLSSHTVHFGGPVQKDQLFFVHTLGEKIPESIAVAPGLWWLGDFEVVKEMIEKKEIGTREIRFFIGYAGWSPGQLEVEMKKRSWYVAKMNMDLVFDDDPSNLWQKAVNTLGSDYRHMVNFPEDPSLN